MKPALPQFQLLTFYHFVDIPADAVESVCLDHLQFCIDVWLKGRVYIGTEGISSTVSGNLWQCRAYRLFLESSLYFKNIADIDSKSTLVDGHQFAKLIVKVREEIVVMGDKVTQKEVQHYKKELTPEAFKKIIDTQDPDYLILDMRNDYEYRLGHFKWAIPAGTVNFREVPELLKRYKQQAQWKKIIWYCTGGIRCEKASVLANKAGIEEVYSVEGGVVKYVNTINDGNWLGNLYTFDDRVSTYVGDNHTHTTIGTCLHSGQLTDHCDNCRYTACNARMIVDLDEYKKHLGFCSRECFEKGCETLLVKDVEWDTLKKQKAESKKYKEGSSSYKELRSIIKAGKMTHIDAQKIVSDHLIKKLWHTSFPHATAQKEGVIVMD